ncbi:MAG: glycosyltransferase family 39 protein [Nitrospira sp.]|nr:glycosyltransferase family 39 protein [Nitrospira sp.]
MTTDGHRATDHGDRIAPFASPPTRHSSLALLLLLAGLLFFLGLGTLGLTDRDEGRNAEAAREMVETGDWVSPTFNYEPRFAKPVFVYWLMGGAYRLFGASEFTARLPSAALGVALILIQYLFLARLRGPMLGLLGGLMLLLNVEIVAIGRLALTDSTLIFFTTLSLFGFWLGLHGEGRTRQAIWLFYLGMAVGMLTKGPVGIAVPLLAAVPYLTLTRRWGQFWQKGFPLAGLVLLLALALPWYAAMFSIHGARYGASAQADTIGRFLGAMEGHSGTLLFYLPILLFGFFPWSGFLPVALYQAFKSWRDRLRVMRDEHLRPTPHSSPVTHHPSPITDELELFAAIWLVGVLLFFSLSATRLPHYIGPLYPAAAILAASYWNRCLTDPSTPGLRAALHLLTLPGYLLGAALVAASALYTNFVEQIAKEFPIAAQVDPGSGPLTAGIILLLGMGLVRYFGRSDEQRRLVFWTAGGAILLVLLIAIQVTLPRLNKYFITPPQELAYAAGLNLGPSDHLILYGSPKPSWVFYAKRKAIVIQPGEEANILPYLSPASSSSPLSRTMILLPSRLKSKLPAEAAQFSVVLERYGYSLLANKPMVDIPPMPQPSPSLSPHG